MQTSKQQAKEIADYITQKSQKSYSPFMQSQYIIDTATPKSAYSIRNDECLFALIAGEYTRNEFTTIIHELRHGAPNGKVNVIFYKDGKNYFRSRFADNELMNISFKQKQGLSLKLYSPRALQRTITMSNPERIILENQQQRQRTITYYQPQSQRLEQGILKFTFVPLIFDYTHVPLERQFGRITRESKRDFIWTDRKVIF